MRSRGRDQLQNDRLDCAALCQRRERGGGRGGSTRDVGLLQFRRGTGLRDVRRQPLDREPAPLSALRAVRRRGGAGGPCRNCHVQGDDPRPRSADAGVPRAVVLGDRGVDGTKPGHGVGRRALPRRLPFLPGRSLARPPAKSDQLTRQREASAVVALRAPTRQIRHAAPGRNLRPGAGLVVAYPDWRYFRRFFPPFGQQSGSRERCPASDELAGNRPGTGLTEALRRGQAPGHVGAMTLPRRRIATGGQARHAARAEADTASLQDRGARRSRREPQRLAVGVLLAGGTGRTVLGSSVVTEIAISRGPDTGAIGTVVAQAKRGVRRSTVSWILLIARAHSMRLALFLAFFALTDPRAAAVGVLARIAHFETAIRVGFRLLRLLPALALLPGVSR